jgi:ABC-type proline/glycine betaine transport system permease subunit
MASSEYGTAMAVGSAAGLAAAQLFRRQEPNILHVLGLLTAAPIVAIIALLNKHYSFGTAALLASTGQLSFIVAIAVDVFYYRLSSGHPLAKWDGPVSPDGTRQRAF